MAEDGVFEGWRGVRGIKKKSVTSSDGEGLAGAVSSVTVAEDPLKLPPTRARNNQTIWINGFLLSGAVHLSVDFRFVSCLC